MLSTSLGEECLGQHYGDYQMANLGDGQGNVTELEVLRWNYGDIYIGTCKETFNGGLHLRYWRQNNTYVSRNLIGLLIEYELINFCVIFHSGAYFMAYVTVLSIHSMNAEYQTTAFLKNST